MTAVDLPTLLAELEVWAGRRDKPVDASVLSQLLDLRNTYDGSPPNSWPTGSVTDLLLRLWPAKGDGPTPDPDSVAVSIDTFVRFLRNTGRMAAGSADPKDLAKEARRAAPKMAEAELDRSPWSPGKVLGDHAQKIGLDLDGAESLDDLNARLALSNSAWNSLPIHERQRLMPHPGDEYTAGVDRAMAAYGTDYAPHALMLSMQYELPEGDLPTLEELVPWARQSFLVKDAIRLVEALDERVSVTETGALQAAHARELHQHLDLRKWEAAYEGFTGETQDPQWQSAHDLVSLERLWGVALTCGWVSLGATAATVHQPDAMDDDSAVDFALRATMDVTLGLLDSWDEAIGLTYAVMRSCVLERGRVSWEEIASFTEHWLYPQARLDNTPGMRTTVHEIALHRAFSDAYLLHDAGVFKLDKNGLALTPLGEVFVSDFLNKILEIVA